MMLSECLITTFEHRKESQNLSNYLIFMILICGATRNQTGDTRIFNHQYDNQSLSLMSFLKLLYPPAGVR